jgi:hypothetical protein
MGFLDFALGYVSRGWFVFPCAVKQKHPRVVGGFLSASNDVEQITRWWKAEPEANIGLALGASGLLAVDVETENHVWLADLIDSETWCQRTTGGGWHFLFRQPPTTVKNVPGIRNLARDGKRDVEIRGDGGYIVLAPSESNTRKTEGIHPYVIARDVDPVACPQWLIDAIAEATKKPSRPKPPATNQPPSTATTATTVTTVTTVTTRNEKALAGAAAFCFGRSLGNVAAAQDGSRNDTLYREACFVAKLVLAGHVSFDEALSALSSASTLDDDEAERTARNGLKWGMENGQAWDYRESSLAQDQELRKEDMRLGEALVSDLIDEPDAPEGIEAIDDECGDDDIVAVDDADEYPPPPKRDVKAFVAKQALALEKLQALGGLCASFPRWVTSGAVTSAPGFAIGATVALGGALASWELSLLGQPSCTYAVLIGGTSSGKSWPLECVKHALSYARPAALGGGGFASGKALGTLLHSAADCQHGVLYCIDEIGEVLRPVLSSRKTKPDAEVYAALLALATVGQGPHVTSLAMVEGGGTRVTYRPALGIFGAATPVSFFGAMSGTAATDGFLGRWLVFEDVTTGPPPKTAEKLGRIGARPGGIPSDVRQALDRATKAFTVRISSESLSGAPGGPPLESIGLRIPQGGSAYETHCERSDALVSSIACMGDLAQSVGARALEMAQRVALALTHLRHDGDIGTRKTPVEIGQDAIGCAWDIVELSFDAMFFGVESRMADTPWHAVAKHVEATVEALCGDKGHTTMTALRRSLGQRYPDSDVVKHVRALEAAGCLHLVRVGGGARIVLGARENHSRHPHSLHDVIAAMVAERGEVTARDVLRSSAGQQARCTADDVVSAMEAGAKQGAWTFETRKNPRGRQTHVASDCKKQT